jgi:ElaB/YqjD/DUF883 family membrane-anchored ribosome-binding protein
MVQQTQEQKGGISFGQVAGSLVAAASVGGIGNHVMNRHNVNARLGGKFDLSTLHKDIAPKVTESLDKYKEASEQISANVNTLRENYTQQGKEAVVAAIDFGKEKGADIRNDVASLAKEMVDTSKEVREKIATDMNNVMSSSASSAKDVAEKVGEAAKENSEKTAEVVKETADSVKTMFTELRDKSAKALDGVGALDNKQKFGLISLTALAGIGTYLALRPKSKVSEPQHQGMAQGRSAQPQLA